MIYSIIDLPVDILREIFRYLVGVCDYDNFNQYNMLKLSIPDVAYLYHQSLSIQKRSMVLNSHHHFRYKETSVDLCGYVYEPFILEIYNGLVIEINKMRRLKLSQYKNYYSDEETSKTKRFIPKHETITFHPKQGIPSFYVKHMKSIVDDFCHMCRIRDIEFSHLCCGDFGIVCKIRDMHKIT